jgi:hypothetical protein
LLSTVTPDAATPPTETDANPERFVPVSVITVPPETLPMEGLTEVSVGVATWVNAFARSACPPTVVTTTLFDPGVPAGVTAVIVVALTTVIFVASAPPTVTDDAPSRFVPVRVIVVPPLVSPTVGETFVKVGDGTIDRATRKPTSATVRSGEFASRFDERW